MEIEQRIDRLENFASETRERLARIETQIGEMNMRLATSMATKEDIAELRADIYKLEVRMVKWFIFTAFAMTSVMGGIAVAAMKLIH